MRRPALSPLLLIAGCLLAAIPEARPQPLTLDPPNPLPFANFGYAVAGFSPDRFLVSAFQLDKGDNASVGEAYLFKTNGALLATLTNPVPTPGAFFGTSLDRVGSDKIVVGASEADRSIFIVVGEAYLFDTNGTRLTTFMNPAPGDYAYFGDTVAGLGPDRVVVGADGTDVGGNVGEGRAYLFSTGGALLQTFVNPAPAAGAAFGFGLAALGSDRVIIGAFGANTNGVTGAGAAYLFNTNGVRIATFTNPAPATDGFFGYAIATLGTDRVIVGAFQVPRAGQTNVGQAYLFNTNGVLLATFNDPVPTAGANFGGSVAAVGTDRLLISTDRVDIGTNDAPSVGLKGAGAAYLFNTNGTLLATYTNPSPAGLDLFGWSVAGINSNLVVLGAPQVDLSTNAINAGRAFLFKAPPGLVPNLAGSFGPGRTNLLLKWITPEHLILQETASLAPPPIAWMDSAGTVTTNGATNSVMVPFPPGSATRYYRLRWP